MVGKLLLRAHYHNIVVILLQAGDKSDQQKDIAIAKSYLNNIKETEND